MPKIISVLTLIIISVFACEADRDSTEENTIDHREPYVDSFTFSSYSFSYLYMADTTYYGDTIIFDGSIELDNEKDSVIVIKYRPPESDGYTCGSVRIFGSEIAPLLGANGSLSFPYVYLSCRVGLVGQFYSIDSLHFNVFNDRSGGRWGHIVSGARK